MYTEKNSERVILREFVSREVYANISDLADHLFGCDNSNPYADRAEFLNYEGYFCPHCGGYVGKSEILFEDEETGELRCPKCGEPVEEDSLEWTEAEIVEHYIVSEFLGRHLARHDEVVLPRHLGWIWGRQGSGQAIYMDGVIREICVGLELIEERKE